MQGIYSHQGITFIELMAAIAITAILALVAAPSIISLFQTNRLVGTAQNLYYALQYARSEAIKRNVSIYVSFTTGSTWCYGINPSTSCNCNTAGNCALGTTKASSDLSLSLTGLTGTSLIFESNHGASNVTNGLATYTSTGRGTTMSVEVGRLGNLLICSAQQVSGYPTC